MKLWIVLTIAVVALGTCAAQAPQQGGTVVLSRSLDQNGAAQNGHMAGQATVPPAPQMVAAATATDAEREAVTYTDFDVDVRLRSAAQQIAVRALVTVRNDGKAPLKQAPLQISSSLNWERIRVGGKYVSFQVATLNSDADHTGQLHEAAVPLAAPLAVGQSVQLDVSYAGAIAPSAQRLLAIGTPEAVALHSDWDGIGVEFTGLRGFGNVVWYPATAVPVILGDGARVFDEMGEHKLRIAGARFRLRLTDEFPHGHAPTVALVNGHPVALNVIDNNGSGFDVPGVATAETGSGILGFEAPSLFVAVRVAHPATNTTIWTAPQDNDAAAAWAEATAAVTPFLQGWLGQRPRAQLTLLDLPDAQDMAYETGALLVTSIQQGNPEQIDGIMAHALTHAWMQSPRAWLSEGVAHFMGTLWIEKSAGPAGRTRALESLEAGRPALALAEPASPGESAGQPVADAISPAFYRTKATYIFWMLRDVAGDATLSAALRAYDPAQDYARDSGRSSMERLLEQAGARRDLHWFFTDWVDTDKGLPDFTIDSAFPSSPSAGSWLVAVNISNSGYAAAEVPVTVRSETNSATQRVLIPARGKVVQRIMVLGKPTEVQVNDGTIPETQASVHITRLADSTPAAPPPAKQ
jgi:hypothetical protein